MFLSHTRFTTPIVPAICPATATFLLLASLALAPSRARATFPGANGEVAYMTLFQQQTTAIFGTASGQLTMPRVDFPREIDNYARWSRDGEHLAFVRSNGGTFDRLMVLEKDGTGLREILNTDALEPGPSFRGFANLAWTDDGRISFVYWDRSSGQGLKHGIYTVGADGSGLTRTVRETSPATKDLTLWPVFVEPDWSAAGRLVYPCFKKPTPTATFEEVIDTCVLDRSTGVTTRLGIKTRRPRWSPLGDTIVFSAQAHNSTPIGDVDSDDIFTIDVDDGVVTRLTFGNLIACGNRSILEMTHQRPTYSPDGKSIVFRGIRGEATGGSSDPCASTVGLWTMPAAGGPPSLLVLDRSADLPDWQPLVPKLTVDVDDGHGNALRGLKVELRMPDGTVADDQPNNQTAGAYAFADVAPGTYVIRVTLIDADGVPDDIPSFDVRHAASPAGAAAAVWVERRITIAEGVDAVSAAFSLTDGPEIVDSNVAPTARHRLDDMANIFLRVRQFVDWIDTNLTSLAGIATLPIYTFATNDPSDGTPVDPRNAYYKLAGGAIVLGTVESEYESRDGVIDAAHADDAPENTEWHEFTHHLFHTFVVPGPSTGVSHAGYPNPDTSDSMDEGFAVFLPALAAHDIKGTTAPVYDGMFDVEWHNKAWADRYIGGFLGGKTEEDTAVASLFWDLVDDASDSEDTEAVGSFATHYAVTYRDDVHLSLGEVWERLTTAHPATVMALRDAFGRDPADIVLDLDGDLVPDIAELDQVFLMHGFFPIAGDQTIEETHTTYHYDVTLAQRENAGAPPNGAVGRTDHRNYDATGALVSEQIPRFKIPLAPAANVGIELHDESGMPLAGSATLVMTVRYPGFEDTLVRTLASGAGALVHLELPPYFDYLRPADASLPPCDPAHDVRVDVTLAATMNGITSPDQPSFDSCTYQRAAATASGPAALSFVFTFPTPPTSSSTTSTSTSSTTLATTTSTTLPPVASKCAGTKLKAAGKKASCLLALGAKVAKSGVLADPAKVQTCTDKLASAFAKAEAKPPCLTTGDVDGVEATIDGFVADVTEAIDVVPDPSKCQSKKLKAVAMTAKCLFALEAKEAATAKPINPDKLAGCDGALSSAFAKADDGTDCGAATGDATTIGARVDTLVDQLDDALAGR